MTFTLLNATFCSSTPRSTDCLSSISHFLHSTIRCRDVSVVFIYLGTGCVMQVTQHRSKMPMNQFLKFIYFWIFSSSLDIFFKFIHTSHPAWSYHYKPVDTLLKNFLCSWQWFTMWTPCGADTTPTASTRKPAKKGRSSVKKFLKQGKVIFINSHDPKNFTI